MYPDSPEMVDRYLVTVKLVYPSWTIEDYIMRRISVRELSHVKQSFVGGL